MQVREIWRYPVKSLQGESVERSAVGPFGLVGDRGWALFDVDTGLHLTARRRPDLLFAAAHLIDDGVMIILPDGTETNDDQALSDWLGQPVELRRASPDSVGTYEIQDDEDVAADASSWTQWSGPSGSFHDSTRSQISLASLDAFGSWDRRRFRTNIIVDQPGEEALVDHRIAIGSSRFDVTKRIDRCVMVTRPQASLGNRPALDRDLTVLKTINTEHGGFLSVGAMVAGPGQVAVGDPVEVVSG